MHGLEHCHESVSLIQDNVADMIWIVIVVEHPKHNLIAGIEDKLARSAECGCQR
jgi:hypothetical protein